MVSFKPDDVTLSTKANTSVHLADWGSPLISSVIRVLADPANDIRLYGRAPLLLRFLALVSAWRVSCLFVGRLCDICVAAFDIRLAGDEARPTVYGSNGDFLHLADASWVGLDRQSCLLWRGDPLRAFYMEGKEGLLELIPECRNGGSSPALEDWLTSLTAEDRQILLDGCRPLFREGDVAGPAAFDGLFDRSVRIGDRTANWTAHWLVYQNQRFYLAIEPGECLVADDPPSASISGPFGKPIELSPYRSCRGTAEASSQEGLLVYRSELTPRPEERWPFRVSLDSEGIEQSKWLAVSSLRQTATRRRIRNAHFLGFRRQRPD